MGLAVGAKLRRRRRPESVSAATGASALYISGRTGLVPRERQRSQSDPFASEGIDACDAIDRRGLLSRPRWIGRWIQIKSTTSVRRWESSVRCDLTLVLVPELAERLRAGVSVCILVSKK